MIEKRKKNMLKKILISLMIIIIFMIIKSINSQAFTMGSLDVNGGTGITAGPQPYFFGEYYCVNSSLPLTRTEDGTKNSNRISHYNRNYAPYYNQTIDYAISSTSNVEQSIAAGYLAYLLGGGSNAEFQNVVWTSGVWANKAGYVSNLDSFNGATIFYNGDNQIYGRAGAWANFYYNLLQNSNMQLQFNVAPTSENDLRIYVDQNNRTYTEGPYMINIVDASGASITNNKTEYMSGQSLGDLVYNEIIQANVGSNLFQFIKLNSATATVTYNDGSSEEYSTITILDANGTVLQFPKPGQIFYIKINVPSNETRTVYKIEPHFKVDYLKNLSGNVTFYKASTTTYELSIDMASKLSDSHFFKASNNDRNTSFYTNRSIKDLYDNEGIVEKSNLLSYLQKLILNNGKYNYGTVTVNANDFNALFTDTTIWGQTKDFSNVNDYYNSFKTDYQAYEKASIKLSRTTWIYNGHEYTTQDGAYNDCVNDGNNPATDIIEKKYYKYGGTESENLGYLEGLANSEGEKKAKDHCDSFLNSHNWLYSWINHLPICMEYGNVVANVEQPVITIQLKYGGLLPTIGEEWGQTNFDLIGRDCTVEIGGKVWVDDVATKETNLNGRLNSGNADTKDYRYAGMQVELFLARDRSNRVGYAITDSQGGYHFDNLNALEKYIVVFTYNGQIYQQTYYKDDLSGGFSNAKDIDRTGFNDRFDRIDSYPSNYNLNGWKIAYGKNVKLRRDDGTYIQKANSDDALMYIDAWNQFVSYASSTGSYDGAYNSLSSWLKSYGVGTTDTNGVIQFIKDCMITAETRNYPVYEQFVIKDIDNPPSNLATETAVGQTWNYLYTQPSDQSRNVDFGINERDTANLALQKDVYKATVRVNGKTQTYIYNNKDVDEDENWEITIRAADGLFNGATRYTREIRKSEYLYDGTIYSNGGTNARDLKVYVTYRITVRNQSQTYDTVLNEVVDYFDTSEYVFDGTWDDATQSYKPNEYSDFEHSTVTSYIGDINGNYIAPLVVKRDSVLGNGRGDTNLGHGYYNQSNSTDDSPLYLSGTEQVIQNDKLTPIVMPVTNEQGEVTGTSAEITKGGGMAFIYLTFEVKKSTDENGMANRVQMDVHISDPNVSDKGVGKQNIAEINGYSTYYGKDATIPNCLDGNNNTEDTNVDGQKAGLIDLDSTVGNLSAQDLIAEGQADEQGNYPDGHLNVTDNPVTNRAEDDTDQAPNIRLVFPKDDSYERVATGYVYEDVRNEESNLAVVGNGRYSDTDSDEDGNKDVKVNGVTVQLVELVQNVDGNGIPIRDKDGNYEYLGEYIWTAREWKNGEWLNVNSSSTSNSLRYYSGQGVAENKINGNNNESTTVSPIISGPEGTAVEISGYELTEEGQYSFKAMPAGDFIIRFIYGDTTQTVLTTATGEGSEVVDLLKDTTADKDARDGYVSTSGLNAKSYNGQDYKSTLYQTIRDNNQVTTVSQDGSYNGINGYKDYDNQNYNYTKSAQQERGIAGQPISGALNEKDGKNKSVNYYYNISESQVQSGISDAKDVGNIRTDVNEYSKGISGIDGEGDTKTLVNGRAEVLASGLKVASTDTLAKDAKTSPDKQIKMIKELMANTEMVAQTGVINAEVEYDKTITQGQSTDNSNSINYVLDDIDLGLSERPIAQLKMNKEVSNVRITLQNGTVLFDTNRPVTNMPFAEHEGHKVRYSPAEPTGAYRLMEVILAQNSAGTPELITAYMDEELMYGAKIEVDYTFTVTNVGEVDYLSNDFYYTGYTENTSLDNISKTVANTVVDYVSNNIEFLPTNSKNSDWSIRIVDDLTTKPDPNTELANEVVGNTKDLINNKYYDTLNTYKNIVTTKALGDELYPEAAAKSLDGAICSTSTTMMLSNGFLSPDSGEETLVFNNLSEILQVSNTQGRRLKWSITGNQPMANQDYGPDTSADPDNEIYTKVDVVTPKEIDADSSQEILLLPPTGANRNYTLWVVVGVIALAIIAGGVILIIRYFKKR